MPSIRRGLRACSLAAALGLVAASPAAAEPPRPWVAAGLGHVVTTDHLRVHFGGIDFPQHASDVEIIFLFRILNRCINHGPGMLDGLIAVCRGGKNIERVAEDGPAELVRFVYCRFRYLRL